jgi:hypothetical protein
MERVHGCLCLSFSVHILQFFIIGWKGTTLVESHDMGTDQEGTGDGTADRKGLDTALVCMGCLALVWKTNQLVGEPF